MSPCVVKQDLETGLCMSSLCVLKTDHVRQHFFPCSLAPVFVLGSQWYDILWPNVVSLLQVMPPHRPTGNPAVKEKGWSRTPPPPPVFPQLRPSLSPWRQEAMPPRQMCWSTCIRWEMSRPCLLLHACYANLTPAAVLVLWCCVAEAQLQVEFHCMLSRKIVKMHCKSLFIYNISQYVL